ncbi:acyl-CoA dehydrogenase family protein [Actinoallomurus sp. NBC_01490]|uniref:acyl-CoA dehydrogenase family protein n=1 Tax=Actinoallomurus sp. NBC_01490 TaxID=2903557 RepID=UPI002E2F2BF7|nr:acyl-CoA dehydrogenase family protein [Actinoallomurus sp. NBC_01490]
MAGIPELNDFRAFFTGEVEAAAPEIERTDRIPPTVLDGAARIGAYRLTLPESHGGFGLSTVELLPYLEAAAMGPGAGRMLVHLSNGIWRPILRYGNERQRGIVSRIGTGDAVVAFCLTEATAGTGRDLRSRAVRDGDGWLLTGEKHLITFADRADWFLLVAASDERAAKDSLTAFLIPRDTPGFGIDATQRTMGLHGTGHAWLRYDGMRLDDAHRLGAVGEGLDVGLYFLDYSRISLSACMVGLGERALDEAARFALRRATFGRPIADRQAIQAHLADMRADIDAGRGLVRRAAEAFDRGEEVTAAASTAKLFCLNMIGRVTDLALRVHGGFGYSVAAPIERIYRDARGFWFEEGTQEIQQLVVARKVLTDAARKEGS